MESISSNSTSPHLRLHPRFWPTQPLANRIFRALRHHLCLLHRFDSTFFILGATGNVYTVSLTTTPSCTCPDRTTPCKHILFVLIRVLGVSVSDTCLRRRSLRPCRISRLLSTPTLVDSLASANVQQMFHLLFFQARQPKALEIEEGTICPICLEEMEKEDRISAVACGSCKNVVHEECLMRWRRSRGRRGASCVICRARWRDRIDQERYLNLAPYVSHGQDQDAGDGCVYSWGRGMFGRLGTGSEADELSPVRVKFVTCGESEEKRLNFVAIAAGAYHSLALADDGLIWSWGYNIYGQLGVDGEISVVPRLMEQFLELSSPESETKRKESLKVCSVKAGGMMSVAIDNLGALWMWGNCPQNSSSTESGFSLESNFTPIPVRDFYGHTVVKVACGNEHVVALVSVGETYKGEDLLCYSWGNNSHGQLGLGDRTCRIRPEIVETFNQDSSWAVYEVACGAFHTALLSHKKGTNDKLECTCWTFGLGDNGQLGHGTTQSTVKPEPVKELPQHIHLVSVDCGLFHTSVVSSAGDVWSWGMMRGLGLCPDASFTGTDAGDAISPLQITGLYGPKFHDPVQIACGAAHTVLVANGGYRLWSWGRGKSGVLGNGKTMDILAPSLLMWPAPTEDFKDQELNNVTEDKVGNKGSEEVGEAEKRLSLAMDEMKLLQSKLSIMERYASILHGSLFGKPFAEEDIPISLRNAETFDIAKEWENMLESADRSKLIRLELFYRNMLAGVKDMQMKRRIQEIVKEYLPTSSLGK